MDVEPVWVKGYHEILALHRALFEAKFDDLDSTHAGSPFIAAIQHRLADALEAVDPGGGWRTWRAAEAHTDRVEAVRRQLAGAGGWWRNMDEQDRRRYIQDLLAPLRVSDELLAELAAM
ncbi:hypothetical protein [Plantactinospora soyae]|uniref:Acyl-CoA reductase-like NAD-dependent aldehyde dehydrogenase n=1 Tax=Plantactinospora soyae TaxID=1544732 RepID=A0A927LZH1_9ACTN|nr:hypothetical protein [Plantactinospora soyae]MBE1485362.1 acyl-CoA reductase-like NAD-dependent aldehyde dehydrogenase [Plantactinospora soyae]